ncbi:MAG: DMT family transporter [Gammaproteobacteria bacterium]|nr:DMT family transporter [Gammaproteobacteria bacterium]
MNKLNPRMLVLFLFIVITWGIAWPVNKIGLQHMTPLWYTTLRLIIGTVTMMGIVIALKKFTWPKPKDYPLVTLIGFLQISLYILLTNIGLYYLPAGHSSMLAYTTPLWVMPIATLFFREEASALKWLGFLLGIGGLVILLSPWQLNWRDADVIFGSVMLLLASLCWAISMLCVRYMAWTKSPLELIPWQLLAGTIPILIYTFIQEPIFTVTWSPSLILSLLYTGVLVTGLSYWGGVIINKEVSTTIVSLGFLIVPVFSLIISAIFMNEAITILTASAMGLIVLGLACVVA